MLSLAQELKEKSPPSPSTTPSYLKSLSLTLIKEDNNLKIKIVLMGKICTEHKEWLNFFIFTNYR